MRRIALTLALLLLSAPTVRAEMPAARALVLLTAARSAPDLRSKLLAYSDSARATDHNGAGEAQFYAGQSYERAGRADSAIVCFQAAVDLRGATEETLALVDALLARRSPGDLARAQTILGPLEAQGRGNRELHTPAQARLAWVLELGGHSDSAGVLFSPLVAELSSSPEWRYRMGRVAVANHDLRTAAELLIPNAVLSRRSDREVVELLDKVGKDGGHARSINAEVAAQVRARDAAEAVMIKRWRGVRGQFPARDGFMLGGIAVPASGRRQVGTRPRAAVIVVAPEDSLPLYDSLTVALSRSGIAVMLLDPRGSGWSVGPACPLHDAWTGNEQAMQTRVARDVRVAVQALAQATPADSTRYLVIGAGTATAIAVEAAELDRRARALLLVSPLPDAAERAPMLGRVGRLQLPVFLQSAPEDDFAVPLFSDALYQAGNHSASRVADATSEGRGAAQFRADDRLMKRFTEWLASALPPRSAPPSTRPAPRR
jgi:tetratricopeptide (TPR) repeat protein